MASVGEHYENVLADVYSWMFGGFEAGVQRNTEFFNSHKLKPEGSAVAVDLGAGCGFQSIPLARAGFRVTAIDIDAKLLGELQIHCGDLPVVNIQDDLMNFGNHVKNNAELIVCMTDTLLHLESKENVDALFTKVYDALEPGGRFVITFRDLTQELKDTDRFLPVRSDENIIFTCFLEYEPETVKVHDIVYKRTAGNWDLFKSWYRKLRLSKQWVDTHLAKSGFNDLNSTVDNGLVTTIARK